MGKKTVIDKEIQMKLLSPAIMSLYKDIIKKEKKNYFSKLQHHHLCEECPGYCCKRFAMVLPLTYSRKIDWERALEESPNDEERYTIAFAKEHFIRLKPYKHFSTSFGVPYKSGYEKLLFTCKLFDPVLGICLDYKNRPRTCRIFFCPPLKKFGEIPKPDEMLAGKVMK